MCEVGGYSRESAVRGVRKSGRLLCHPVTAEGSFKCVSFQTVSSLRTGTLTCSSLSTWH